jgi:putative restriction endonuclease
LLILHPVFFPPERFVRAPADWPVRTQSEKRYALSMGEGARIWEECRAVSTELKRGVIFEEASQQPRYGQPTTILPRLGQGTFRVAVTEAYGRSCAVTGEHSLPVLDAAHIIPFGTGGKHEVSNGLLLRADLHRLFDQGYVTVTPDLKLDVGNRLREDFLNGKSYYPLHGTSLAVPLRDRDRPRADYLRWHNDHVFLG